MPLRERSLARADDAEAALEDLLARAKAAGADDADALAMSSRSLSAGYRLGELEETQRAEECVIGLRVFVGRAQAAISTADLREEARAALVERAIAMARAAPEDPYAGLAEPESLAARRDGEGLEIWDSTDLGEETLQNLAKRAEDAARAVDGVTNSGGAGAGCTHTRLAYATSHGFFGAYAGSEFSLSVAVLAGPSTAMERDYAMASTRFFEALDSPESLGRQAGERAVARLGPGRPDTASMPVVFHPRVANSLLGHFAQAVSGSAVARGTSFLKDRMGEAIFAPGLRIVDDALRERGLRSRPFDAEGVASRSLPLVENGVLQSWLLDSSSAAKLGWASTGHAMRTPSGLPAPSPTNLYMEPGTRSPEELIADAGGGLYVTELIGMGVNPVTGDYSRGAAGFLIEGGEIAGPVSEITIAGNLKDMFRALTPASDLAFHYGVNAPTLCIDSMTVAGA